MFDRTNDPIDAVVIALRPSRTRLFLSMFDDPAWRPPVIEEMMEDLERLMASTVSGYIDQSNVAMHFEDMVGDCRLKLAKVLSDGCIEKFKLTTRKKFFSWFKAVIKNHVASYVQKHVFTKKRGCMMEDDQDDEMTGHVLEEDIFSEDHRPMHRSRKRINISMDDPDANIQVGETPDFCVEKELLEDIEILLSEVEKLVLHQLLNPNLCSLIHAQVDSHHGHRPGMVKIRVGYRHMAVGLGMELSLFQTILNSIRDKCRTYMQNQTPIEEARKITVAEATLCQIFKLQIPPTIDGITRKRLFTLVARDQIDKLTDDIVELLKVVGAYPPVKFGEQLSCYGVLWQRNHRICSSCGLQESCKTLALNIGLGDMTLSNKLLGSKLTKIPAILPTEPGHIEGPDEKAGVVVTSERDEEILDYLRENFKQVTINGELFYRTKDKLIPPTKLVISVGMTGSPMKLRLCSPIQSLRSELVVEKRGAKNVWFVPVECSAQECIDLINQHIKLIIDELQAQPQPQPEPQNA